MSDTNKDQHEPSMEEILASIRRIISEDGEGAEGGEAAPPAEATPPASAPAQAAPAAPAAAAPAPAAPRPAAAAPPPAAERPKPALIADVEDDDDVLLLTEEAEDEAPAPPAPSPLSFEDDEPPPEPRREPEPLAFEQEPEPKPEPEPVHEAAPQASSAAAMASLADRLLSDRAAAASLAAMSELVSRSQREPNIESLPMGNANNTLEDITRELLRPILKSWLDENLPPIVERIVREEIGRLALDAQRR